MRLNHSQRFESQTALEEISEGFSYDTNSGFFKKDGGNLFPIARVAAGLDMWLRMGPTESDRFDSRIRAVLGFAIEASQYAEWQGSQVASEGSYEDFTRQKDITEPIVPVAEVAMHAFGIVAPLEQANG